MRLNILIAKKVNHNNNALFDSEDLHACLITQLANVIVACSNLFKKFISDEKFSRNIKYQWRWRYESLTVLKINNYPHHLLKGLTWHWQGFSYKQYENKNQFRSLPNSFICGIKFLFTLNFPDPIRSLIILIFLPLFDISYCCKVKAQVRSTMACIFMKKKRSVKFYNVWITSNS